MSNNIEKYETSLLEDVSQILRTARQNAYSVVNTEMVYAYWLMGKRIVEDEQQGIKKAGYGESLLKKLSVALSAEFGKGFSYANLRNFRQFYLTYTDDSNCYALRSKLSWTHLRSLMYIDDEIKRSFYLEMCINEKWSTRLLQERINSMLFERTAISKNPEETIKRDLQSLKYEQKISADLVFRDPYLLNFLGLSDTYSEQDLESAIISEIQKFIIELGSDFAFIARQKRITIDNRDYYIDLLFFHRKLKCLIAIELKLGEFEASYKGQMELYLNYLDKYERMKGETSPIGLILCSGKNSEHIELMQLKQSNIKVAEYMTKLPPKKLLLDKLRKAIKIARNKESKGFE